MAAMLRNHLVLGLVIISAGVIFVTFQGVTNVVANISWAFAIALAAMLIPVMYTMAKKMARETS